MNRDFPVFGEDSFDPDNVSNKTMDDILESIENFLELRDRIMVIPPELEEKHGKQMREAAAIIRKDVCKKLKKHDRSIFVSD